MFYWTILLLLAAWPAMGAERPNFLIIFTDDQCFRSIGYANEQLKTPHLDRLAGDGMIFENCYVASPICAASRASMMTGLYPQQHGVIALNTRPFQTFRKGGEKAHLTLANRLGMAGYHSAFYGKSHLGDPRTYGFHEGTENKDVQDIDAFAGATQFVEKAAKMDKPFFLWLAPRQPHVPLVPEEKWLELYDKKEIKLDPNFRREPLKYAINNQGKAGEYFYRDSNYTHNWKKLPAGPPRDEASMRLFIKAYYATISHLDQQVGSLINRLDELGLGEDTLIIYLSDNGYHLGNHGLGNKITMHEESVKVPMWIRWKGMVDAGVRNKELVSTLDIYPTLIELAGAERPAQTMGKAIAVGRGPLQQQTGQLAVFSECTGVGGQSGEGHRMIRMRDWKLILTDQNEWHYYDLQKDPFEQRNLYGKAGPTEEVRLQSMQIQLHAWMKRIGDRKIPAALLK